MTTQRSRSQWNHSDEAECKRAGAALEIVGQRWSPSILIALARGTERFTEIAAAATGISARMLTVRLKQLQAARLVERIVVPTTPVSVRYRLTPRGVDLVASLQPIAGFVRRWDDA
ncbi:winged helix-turn-helix transcriptional regulator [Catenuloplanes indicus]|uniref:DNA-binding HxlR family transcriptional regulator n=1 Tax=Catenuloplanes indicus TaxID=137267 RepID=A0AAE3W9X2_9ACTN|nr:helix-turn-helix domain-containing protein [Catenuloplanes indicus]MDQ0371167.1 DNA-binding HxlR family transcriptional regulator [Catenuloplanes indicus]